MKTAANCISVAHVVPRIHRIASGPRYSVVELCRSLHDLGADVSLNVLEPEDNRPDVPFDLRYHPHWRLFFRLGVSGQLKAHLRREARRRHLIHNHGLWMMPNVYPVAAVRGSPCKLMVSPRGTLSPVALQRSRRRKFLFWHIYQKRLLTAADCFHATADHECDDIRRMGLKRPVAVIPNGVDIKEGGGVAASATGLRVLLFLARIHPIKGVENLLHAWKLTQEKHLDWELVVAGPDSDGYLPRMEEMSRDLALERIRFTGPAYDEDKEALFRSASLYVLPTFTENYANTVAEALAHGVPVLVTRGAPWSGVERHDCGWWIDVGADPLRRCLDHALSLSREELRDMGERGREWMRRDMAWDRIGEMMVAAYHWLIHGGDRPAWVKPGEVAG